MKHPKTIPSVLLILLCLLIGVAASAGEDIRETRDVDDDATIRIANVTGEIVLIGWDKSQVKIEGELGEGTRRLDVRGGERTLEIEVVVPRRKRYVEDTDLEIHVPKGARVEIETLSSDIEAENLENELTILASSGDVVVDCNLRELVVEVLSGDIDLRGEFGECDIGLTSGDLEIYSARIDRLEVESISGDLVLEIGEVESLDGETVSGEIEFEGRILKRADLESQSGSIELLFPAEPDAEFELATYNGEIENSFGPRPRRVDRWEPEMELSFTSGDGGADIRVETFSGDVILDTK